MRQVFDATFNQYLFNLLFYLLLSIMSLYYTKREKPITMTWLLIVVFCIYSYFAGDWFNYKHSLPFINSDYKDPIYYYFALLSNKNYIVFRLLIWGLATLLVYFLSKRLILNTNVVVFVFIWLFLPTFCYARASLAMASYFCGLAFLIARPNTSRNRNRHWIIGIFLIIMSYYFHRSFLPIVIATPLIFVKFNRKLLFLLFLLFPLVLRLLGQFMNMMMDDLILEGSDFESFSRTAQAYAKQERHNYNWKFMLVSYFKYVGLYIPFIYIIWKTKMSKFKVLLPRSLDAFLTIEIIIIVVSTAFFIMSNTVGLSDVLGYRYLFMTGIPSTMILSYLLQNKELKIARALALMFIVWLSTVGFMVGKLFVIS